MAKEQNKVKVKAKINWGWDAPEDRNGKATRSTKKQVKRTNKNINKKIIKAKNRYMENTLTGKQAGLFCSLMIFTSR